MNAFKSIVKAPINIIIGAFNGLIGGIEKGLNHVIDMINEIDFDVPDWIPVIGGKSFDIDIPKVKAPKIPYLATGVVIPPNAPFVCGVVFTLFAEVVALAVYAVVNKEK